MNLKHGFGAALFLLFVLLSCNLYAITDEEIFRNLQFSMQNPGARSTAMGGAFIGLADDATAAEANPAGLTILTKPEVSFEYRHTEFDAARLNTLGAVTVPGTNVFVATQNVIDKQDRPSFLSVVFPSKNWAFAFSRQEVVEQDATLNEVIQIDNAALGGSVLLDVTGGTSQEIVNYNFSAAFKLSNSFSLGATVRYSKLDWQTDVSNDIVFPIGVNFSSTSVDDSDSGIAYNIGGLWRSPHFSFGAVYKRNTKFEVSELEESTLLAGANRTFPNVLKVPDTFGAGIAIKPNDNITVSADVVRIKYSDLLEGFEAGHNVFTFGYDNTDIQYKVDDATEFHVGSEFIVFVKTVPVALRIGYYNRPSNSLVIAATPGATADDKVILPQVFAERDDFNHFTIGNGFVFGSHFQVDWAGDVSKLDTTFVLSTVVRF